MLYDYTQQGNRSVVISSHITTDLEKLCDYIVYVHEGEVVLSAEKDELLSKYAVYSVDKTQLEELDQKSNFKMFCRDSSEWMFWLPDSIPKTSNTDLCVLTT